MFAPDHLQHIVQFRKVGQEGKFILEHQKFTGLRIEAGLML